MSRRRTRVAVAGLAGVVVLWVAPSSASAHPLGNFSINHAHALRFTPDRIVDDAVVDVAEIPTVQAAGDVDTDGNGTASPSELAAYGAAQCASLEEDLELTVDGDVATFRTTSTSFERLPGQAGLSTTRLECRFEAEVDLRTPRAIGFADRSATDRVGWREITATGDGVGIPDSPVPQVSTTDGLRNYPIDLLDSPLVVREATFQTFPGAADAPESLVSAAQLNETRTFTEGGPLAGVVDRVSRAFNDLVGRRDLTLGVGLLAVALAMLLGASHAVLPGHGKTVMAAYVAGRQGTARDAVIVGATVTATHTGGVLILGLALSLSTALAGETVLAWLGIASGGLIAVLGAALLIGAVRHRTAGFGHGHHHGHHHHGHHHHDHHHDHHDGHDHDDGHDHPDGHDHGLHDHDHRSRASTDEWSTKRETAMAKRAGESVLTVEPPATTERLDVTNDRVAPRKVVATPLVSRRGLIGMGIAGGLVPSPSALVVLLSAIALGRTAFGILLVIGYGIGMAATLTAAGLLLVRLRDRYQNRALGRAGRGLSSTARRWQLAMPYVTASLVLLVGVGLAIRSLGQLG